MLQIKSLKKHYPTPQGRVAAVDGITLDVIPGEILVLLGPSGCGKTSTLRCIAGLESPDEGSICYNDRIFFDSARKVDLSPDKRNLGMIFQSYALWPHKTVRGNIAYPLRRRGVKDTKEVDRRTNAAASMVRCEKLLDRYPSQLSGGQQQRVALARGLVAEPDLLLFDEPLSNLDALLRSEVRSELHELHRRIEFTGVYVTHDQSEALALGDRLVVIRNGSIEQIGAPHEVYANPRNEYVADFMGFSNSLIAHRSDGSWVSQAGQVLMPILSEDGVSSSRVSLRLRPEHVRLVPVDGGRAVAPDKLGFGGRVLDMTYAGEYYDVVVVCEGARVQARVPTGEAVGLAPGVEVQCCAARADARLFPHDGHGMPQASPILANH
jgi:iron(III) transport system ATP-binding protein